MIYFDIVSRYVVSCIYLWLFGKFKHNFDHIFNNLLIKIIKVDILKIIDIYGRVFLNFFLQYIVIDGTELVLALHVHLINFTVIDGTKLVLALHVHLIKASNCYIS
jgi:hypothetical protein